MEFLVWDRREEGLRAMRCASCKFEGAKTTFPLVGEQAVEANLSTSSGRHRLVRLPIEQDLGFRELPQQLPWTPNKSFGAERPMWRRGHEDLKIATVAGFYSQRNLSALALLWQAASEEPDPRVRAGLRFSLTAIANRASRRYQWNAKRPTNVLGGTLYVSSLRYEWNVLSLWKRKTTAVLKFFRDNPMTAGSVEVHRGSATALPLADASVDYIATDPPFGAHIVYSDVSLLWEGWLDEYTDREQEAIVVASGDQRKTVADYEELLCGSFVEMHRVLKPDREATVIFQATDPKVWGAIQRAGATAGFTLVAATTLDKGQPSFKQIKGQTGEQVATSDVVLTLSKSARRVQVSRRPLTSIEALREVFARAGVGDKAVPAGRVFASVNAELLASGAEQTVSYSALLALLREHYEEQAEGWTEAQRRPRRQTTLVESPAGK
ncbi:MAG: DNA methylase [Solirubrobacteraceae bacterium]